MKIKSLQMMGFKSFGDRTEIHFNRQIVGVVGPNGCGKSNIVDAIRWVMGEQSAKGLRGNEMSDVIFNGTSTRKKASFAEVSLVFDNSDKLASAPYTDVTEIMITRRLYRSGESEYLINKVAVRLKDITDLFLGTGSSARAYSIVAQGKVDQIVLAKPEDRRFLLEEAAGIAKYKVRKTAAERKMESTKANLDRVHDIIRELERNARYLDRQVERAEQFRKIQAELRRLDEQVIAFKVTKLDREANVNNEKRDSIRAEFEKTSAAFSEVEAEIESLRFESLNYEKATTTDYEKLIELKEKFSQLDKEMELSAQRVSLLQNQIGEREKDLERIRAKSEAQLSTIQQVVEERDRLKQEWEQKQIEIEKKRGDVQNLDQRIRETEEQASEVSRQIEAMQKQAAKDAQKKEMLVAARVNKELERADFENGLEDLAKQTTEFAQIQNDVEHKLTVLSQESDALTKAVVVLQDSMEKLAQNDKVLVAERSQLNDQIHACDSEIKSLLTLEEHKIGYDLGAQDRKKRTGSSLIMDGLKFRAEYQVAGEAFLSEFGQHFYDQPTESDRDDHPRWSHIARNHSSPQALSRTLLDGVEGEVPELLKEFLSNIEVVESVSGETSDHIRIDLNGRMQIPTGSFVVGSRGIIRRSETPFGRQTELARYRGELERVTDALRTCDTHILESKIASDALQKELEQLRTGIQQNAVERSDRREALAKIQSKRDATSARVEELQLKIQTADERIAQLAAEIQSITQEVGLQEAEQKLALLQSTLGASKTEKAQLDSEWIEARIAFGALQERLDRLEQQTIHVEMTKSEYSHNQSLFEADIKVWTDEITRENEKNVASGAQKQNGADLIRALEIQLAENRQTLNRLRSDLEQRESHRKETQALRDQAQKQLQDMELEHQRLKYEVEELSQLVEVRYHVTLQDILAQVTGTDLERLEDSTVLGALEVEAKELREKIDNFGEVNLLALSEFDEINKRLAFMTSQREDLLKTLDALQSIIDRINKITEFRFRETFKAINHNFQFLFPKLFGGGKAFMTLTNEQNLLETGVEIFAEPPGKKVQAMSLLSGGEKAMTSISLLFALFAYRPASFCILDEVDAPLDEVNTSRYNAIVKEMAQLSQFIVITHNKRTMEVAETLFGITMQDPGVSQIVGVELQEARAFVA
jgi:chromosome segregation protein